LRSAAGSTARGRSTDSWRKAPSSSQTRPRCGSRSSRGHGLLLERLLDAGYVVVPVNPDLIARRRGPAKKDDAEDARIACLLALDRFGRLRHLIPHGEAAGEQRAIARDDERATKDARRLLNRLWADLLGTFARAARHGWPMRFAERIAAALAESHFQPRL